MNSSSHSPSCSQFASAPFSGVSLLKWRPNFLISELFVVLISVTTVNLLVTPLTIFLNVLVILAVKATPQLRNWQIQCIVDLFGRNWCYDWCLGKTILDCWINLPPHWQPRIRVMHHFTHCKKLKSSFFFDFASTLDVDKHREVYIDKISF